MQLDNYKKTKFLEMVEFTLSNYESRLYQKKMCVHTKKEDIRMIEGPRYIEKLDYKEI